MKATVKRIDEMPEYLQGDLMVGNDERGDYGFTNGMQKKMGKIIDVEYVSDNYKSLYDYIDEDGYMYREEWLHREEWLTFEKKVS